MMFKLHAISETQTESTEGRLSKAIFCTHLARQWVPFKHVVSTVLIWRRAYSLTTL